MSKVTGGFWRYENRLIAVLCLMFGVVFFDRNAMSYLAPFVIPELGLSNTQVGMLASGLSFAWAVSALVIGAFSDRTGLRKPILLVLIVVFSLCSFMSGIAASFAVLLAARMLMGLAEGPILPISQSLTALESGEKRRGLNMGVMQNLGSNLIGSFAAPLILVAVAEAVGWRNAFFIAGIPGLICALLVWKLVREPKTHELHPVSAATAERMSMTQLFQHRNMWLCVCISIFMVAWMVLGWAFLPVLFTQLRGMPSQEMSWMMSVLGVSAAAFAFIVPGLSDRIGRKPVMILFTLIGVLYPLAAIYHTGSSLVLAALIFVGWSASGTFPLFMATIPSETIPARYLATSVALVMALGEILGGTTAPTLAGRAADIYDLTAPMWIAMACAIAATVLTLFLKETAPVKVGSAALAPAPSTSESGA